MQRLMVTGGAGFIGSNFTRYMLEKYPDYFIVVYDKLTYAGRRENLQDVAERFGDRYAFMQGDICDAKQVEQTITDYKLDTIVNFAAETHVDRSLTEPGSFIQTDVYGTYVLLEAAKTHQLERYHQVSTDEVYGQVLTGRSAETDPYEPRSPYSAARPPATDDAGIPRLVGSARHDHARREQRRPVPVPGESRAAVCHQRHRRPAAPRLRRRATVRDYQYVLDHCEGIDVVLHRENWGKSTTSAPAPR
jgi:dTDP-glucose 4,6-dehydratase